MSEKYASEQPQETAATIAWDCTELIEKAGPQRVIDCLHACSGISTADLEAGAVGKLVEASLLFSEGRCDCYPQYMTADLLPYTCRACKLRAALKPFAGMKEGT